jgi:hypothetical protein
LRQFASTILGCPGSSKVLLAIPRSFFFGSVSPPWLPWLLLCPPGSPLVALGLPGSTLVCSGSPWFLLAPRSFLPGSLAHHLGPPGSSSLLPAPVLHHEPPRPWVPTIPPHSLVPPVSPWLPLGPLGFPWVLLSSSWIPLVSGPQTVGKLTGSTSAVGEPGGARRNQEESVRASRNQ